MKTKLTAGICILLLCTVATFKIKAQELQYAKPENSINQIKIPGTPAIYTYKLFQAPNKMYGYDIFKNDKFIFHQTASVITHNNSIVALSTKEQAGKAVLLAIEKIKKNQPADLSQDEIKKIISQ